jgi:hypothetical protein
VAAPSIVLDKREPRGIIIQAGRRRQARVPFWAYLWSEETESGACAGAPGGRILESAPLQDGLTQGCRASP